MYLTIALHELATNAVKYGALSSPGGKAHITWSVANEHLTMNWQETGGPPVVPPSRKGFGSMLIEQATDGRALLEFLQDGFRCTLSLSLKT
jgi:two-component sensor histidine kinase